MNGKSLTELRQERANITTQIRAIMDAHKDAVMDATKKDEVTKLEARFDEINASILSEEKQLERERIIGENIADKTPKVADKAAELMDAFKDYIREGSQRSYDTYKAITQASPTQAGYLVAPEKFVMELIKDLASATFMRQKAKVLPPLQGAASLGYPKRTAAMSSFAWGTEIAAPTADTTFAVGKREFKARAATSEILVSKTLIRNAPETDAIVRGEITEEVARGLETAYMTGAGATSPLGLFTASADGISTGRDVSTGNTATEMKFDGLMEAKYLLKSQYQANAEWIFHRTGVKQIAKLKDNAGQYIWQPSASAGLPDLLLGKPVNMSEYAPSTFTTGLYVGIYGDLKYYWIVDSLAMEIQALFELYARTNQVDYITRIETDGAPVLEEAFARVTLA